MSATGAELYKQLLLPAEIRNLPQFMEQSLSPDAGGAAVIADPTPMLRESLDRLRVMHEELAALAVESDGDRAAMRESAADIIKVARRYYELHAEMIESGLADSHPAVALCEEIAPPAWRTRPRPRPWRAAWPSRGRSRRRWRMPGRKVERGKHSNATSAASPGSTATCPIP